MPLAALLLLASWAEPTGVANAALASAREFPLTDSNPAPTIEAEPSAPETARRPDASGDARSPPDPGLRLLFGIGLHGGEGGELYSGGQGQTLGWGILGGYLRIGAQINDFWGIEGEGSGSWVLLSAYARGALTLDYTPSDGFTVALGPAVWYHWGIQYTNIWCAPPPTSAEGAGGTLRLDFHIGDRNARGRNAFTVSLVMDLGGTFSAVGMTEPGLAGGGYVALGYTHY